MDVIYNETGRMGAPRSRKLPLVGALTPSGGYHAHDQHDQMKNDIEQLQNIMGRLLATLTEQRTLTLADAAGILGEYGVTMEWADGEPQ